MKYKRSLSFVSLLALITLSLVSFSCSDNSENLSQLSDFEGNLRGGLKSGEYSLTFDDGPSEHTPRVLDVLAEYGLQATFFVNGDKAEKRPDLLQRMLDEGHLVANHTHTHEKLTSISDEEIIEEVVKAHEAIEPYVDKGAFFFRAPFGAWKLRIAQLLNDLGLDFYVGNIFWDIGGVLTDTYAADWNCWSKGISEYECGRRYMNEMRDRDSGIILMHDVTSKTARMFEYIAPKIVEKDYSFSRLDEIKKYKDKLEDKL